MNKGTGAIKWTTHGNGIFNDISKAEIIYTPSPADLSKGSVPLEVSITSPSGLCVSKKPVTIHFAKK